MTKLIFPIFVTKLPTGALSHILKNNYYCTPVATEKQRLTPRNPKHPVFNHMSPTELKAAIEAKTLAFETALDRQQPYLELQKLYLELKELKYQLVQAELNATVAKSPVS